MGWWVLRRFRCVQILRQTATKWGIAVGRLLYIIVVAVSYIRRDVGSTSHCDERTHLDRGQLIRKEAVVKDLRLILSENREKMPHKK